MNIDIKLHKKDLPDDLRLGNLLAVDGEFMGLNIRRDPLCLIQISSGKNDAHIIQLDRSTYDAPNLKKILSDDSVTKIFHFGRAERLFISPAQHQLHHSIAHSHPNYGSFLAIWDRFNRSWLAGSEAKELSYGIPEPGMDVEKFGIDDLRPMSVV